MVIFNLDENNGNSKTNNKETAMELLKTILPDHDLSKDKTDIFRLSKRWPLTVSMTTKKCYCNLQVFKAEQGIVERFLRRHDTTAAVVQTTPAPAAVETVPTITEKIVERTEPPKPKKKKILIIKEVLRLEIDRLMEMIRMSRKSSRKPSKPVKERKNQKCFFSAQHKLNCDKEKSIERHERLEKRKARKFFNYVRDMILIIFSTCGFGATVGFLAASNMKFQLFLTYLSIYCGLLAKSGSRVGDHKVAVEYSNIIKYNTIEYNTIML
ncbi:hypothetical protein HELRODRAFT_165301 [Helobdella robusta]|uniref:Uncharacterized protein n=1 Tax=Helobdella robusta TaxID=6412 RepID=T1EWK3_HELRO|nr:hypothetical protein HELRODRAFT_165301 [Helobdella robusta]ESN91296.1 hypothetical protein HELRODRAFT_165301 [Helobdella robusta]